MSQVIEWIQIKDTDLLIYLNTKGNESMDAIWTSVSNLLFWIPLYILIVFLFAKAFTFKRSIKYYFTIIILIIISEVAVYYLKEFFGRIRPNNDDNIIDYIRILKTPEDFSFFSNHVTSATTFVMYSILFLRRHFALIFLLFIFPFSLAYSQIYMGIHFPTDVFIGIFTGAILGTFAYKLTTVRVKDEDLIDKNVKLRDSDIKRKSIPKEIDPHKEINDDDDNQLE